MSTNSSGEGPDLSDWISQAEAARLHGVSRQAISKLVRSGRLKSLDVGGHVLVSRSQIVGFRPQSAGRPRAVEERDAPDVSALLKSWSRETRLDVFRRLREEFPIHPLEKRLNAGAEVILEAIDRANPLTLRMIRGVIAEAAFEVHVVRQLGGWLDLPLPVSNPPYDFLLDDRNGPIKVQVKLQRSRSGQPMMANEASRALPGAMYVVETQRTRGGEDRKTGGATRPYKFGEFDMLAVSMYPSSGKWDRFMYAVADWLLPSPTESNQINKYQPIPQKPDEYWTDRFETCSAWLRNRIQKRMNY